MCLANEKDDRAARFGILSRVAYLNSIGKTIRVKRNSIFFQIHGKQERLAEKSDDDGFSRFAAR